MGKRAAGQRQALVGVGLWLVQSTLGAMSGVGGGIWPSLALSALAAAALGVGLVARRGGRRAEGGALIAVGAGQWLLGGAAMLLDAATALVLAHNLNAGLGLALRVGLTGPGRARVGEPA